MWSTPIQAVSCVTPAARCPACAEQSICGNVAAMRTISDAWCCSHCLPAAPLPPPTHSLNADKKCGCLARQVASRVRKQAQNDGCACSQKQPALAPRRWQCERHHTCSIWPKLGVLRAARGSGFARLAGSKQTPSSHLLPVGADLAHWSVTHSDLAPQSWRPSCLSRCTSGCRCALQADTAMAFSTACVHIYMHYGAACCSLLVAGLPRSARGRIWE